MRRHLGTTHRWVGIAAILLFYATGQIMDHRNLDQLPVDSAVRLLYRSRHIYLLFGGMVNVAVWMRFILPASGTGSRIAVVGSLLILVAPVFLACAFFLEPERAGHSSLLGALGVFASYIGLIFYCTGIWRLCVPDVLVSG